MRILFISAFYPPHVIGGWDQLVENFNLQLRARGHVTHVLTSQYDASPSERATGVAKQEGISRTLLLENNLYHYRPLDFFFQRQRVHRANLRALKETIAWFHPDVIFVHGMWLLWKGIPWFAEQVLPGKVVYYVADNWPYAHSIDEDYWRLPANRPLAAVMKQQIARFPLRMLAREELRYRPQFGLVLCVSQAVKKNLAQHLGLLPEQMQVIPNGIELDQFTAQAKGEGRRSGLSLLYAGNITVEKGVHTAIEALCILSQRARQAWQAWQAYADRVHLTIVGSGHPDYEAYLQALVGQCHLDRQVRFLGRVPRGEMPQMFQQHDVLVFPSTGEALPRVVQEAMACGLVVIGTTAGGTGEILVEGETGLTFSPGDAAGLAHQITRLVEDEFLYQHLREQGRNLILTQFDLRKTVSAIEACLQQVASSGPLVRAFSTVNSIDDH